MIAERASARRGWRLALRGGTGGQRDRGANNCSTIHITQTITG